VTDNGTNRSAKVTVATPSKQAEDIYERWPWVEYTVWTRRMLTRLEQSEPTTKWFGHQWPNYWFATQGLYSLEHGTCNYA